MVEGGRRRSSERPPDLEARRTPRAGGDRRDGSSWVPRWLVPRDFPGLSRPSQEPCAGPTGGELSQEGASAKPGCGRDFQDPARSWEKPQLKRRPQRRALGLPAGRPAPAPPSPLGTQMGRAPAGACAPLWGGSAAPRTEEPRQGQGSEPWGRLQRRVLPGHQGHPSENSG